MIRPLDAGLGARRALLAPAEGCVCAVYRKAVYLRMPAGLCALTTASVPPGPLHLRCSALPRCRAGGRVRTDGRTLSGSGWALPLDAPTWCGHLPPPEELVDVINAERVAELVPPLGGRGPGLTPSGDDVLAGLLLVARASGGPGAEPALRALAGQVRTTEIASGFLAWAARGQCIAPAHAVLASLACLGPTATAPACAELASIGAGSGAALLLGLRIGLSVNSADAIAAVSTMLNDCLSW